MFPKDQNDSNFTPYLPSNLDPFTSSPVNPLSESSLAPQNPVIDSIFGNRGEQPKLLNLEFNEEDHWKLSGIHWANWKQLKQKPI
jgi:hypothetical protein